MSSDVALATVERPAALGLFERYLTGWVVLCIIAGIVYGLLFAVATITSSGAPLLRLLTVAAAIGHLTYGALISLAYAVGRGFPFLLLGLFAGKLEAWIARTHRAQRITELVSGITLLGLAGYFAWLGYLL
jgi:cytochrome c biogenesis protein CcdA